MIREIHDLKLAIESWRASLGKGRKCYPIEIKKRAVELFHKNPPKILASQLGICVSLFYTWQDLLKAAGNDLTTPSETSVQRNLVTATKFQFQMPKLKSAEAVARIDFEKASIEILSTDALISICKSLMGGEV
jgi:transposase-like protein